MKSTAVAVTAESIAVTVVVPYEQVKNMCADDIAAAVGQQVTVLVKSWRDDVRERKARRAAVEEMAT